MVLRLYYKLMFGMFGFIMLINIQFIFQNVIYFALYCCNQLPVYLVSMEPVAK